MTQERHRRVLFLEAPPADPSKIPERFAGCTTTLYPLPDLAQLYLMSYLEREGHTVNLVNAVLERLPRDALLKKVTDWHPDVVVLHSVILAKPTDLAILPYLLECAPRAQVFLHGPEPTQVPEEYLASIPRPAAENRLFVFRGEPERHIRDYLSTGEPIGASFVKGGEIVETPHSEQFINIDDLPFTHHRHPAVQRLQKTYFNPKFLIRPVASMLASRGCRWRCVYCVPNSVSFARELEYAKSHPGEKPPAACASPERVVSEFREIAAMGYRGVMVMDDEFLTQRSRTLQICEGLRGVRIQWGCLSRPDCLLDEEVVHSLSEAGCVTIDIGVESFSQPILDKLRRNVKVDAIYDAIRLVQKHKIEPKVNVLFGACCLESEENIRRTVDELIRLKVYLAMFAFPIPFRGTVFYEQALREGFLVDKADEIDLLRKSIIGYPHLPHERLDCLMNEAYRRFYRRWPEVWWRLKQTSSIKSLLSDARLALRLLRRH